MTDDNDNIGEFEAPAGDETVTVPAVFERSELVSWHGGEGRVPEQWEPDRVFIYDDTVRAEAYLGNENWVEAICHTERSARDSVPGEPSGRGWHAAGIGAPADRVDGPGETLWRADD